MTDFARYRGTSRLAVAQARGIAARLLRATPELGDRDPRSLDEALSALEGAGVGEGSDEPGAGYTQILSLYTAGLLSSAGANVVAARDAVRGRMPEELEGLVRSILARLGVTAGSGIVRQRNEQRGAPSEVSLDMRSVRGSGPLAAVADSAISAEESGPVAFLRRAATPEIQAKVVALREGARSGSRSGTRPPTPRLVRESSSASALPDLVLDLGSGVRVTVPSDAQRILAAPAARAELLRRLASALEEQLK